MSVSLPLDSNSRLALNKGQVFEQLPRRQHRTPLGSPLEKPCRWGTALRDEGRNGRLRLADDLPRVGRGLFDAAPEPCGVGEMLRPKSRSVLRCVVNKLP